MVGLDGRCGGKGARVLAGVPLAELEAGAGGGVDTFGFTTGAVVDRVRVTPVAALECPSLRVTNAALSIKFLYWYFAADWST